MISVKEDGFKDYLQSMRGDSSIGEGICILHLLVITRFLRKEASSLLKSISYMRTTHLLKSIKELYNSHHISENLYRCANQGTFESHLFNVNQLISEVHSKIVNHSDCEDRFRSVNQTQREIQRIYVNHSYFETQTDNVNHYRRESHRDIVLTGDINEL